MAPIFPLRPVSAPRGSCGAAFIGRTIALVLGCVALNACKESNPTPKPTAATEPGAAKAEVRGELIQAPPPATAIVASASNAAPSAPPAPAQSQSQTVPLQTSAVTNAAPPTPPTPSKTGEFVTVGFDKLASYPFEVSDAILQANSTNAVEVASKTAEQIPASVRAFDQTRIALKGFMLPLKVEGGRVTEMLIMRDQSMCCYGAVPKINEWVSVKMVGGGVKPIMDQAITMYGKLHVGETRENGYLVGIYQMDGERIDVPTDN